MNKKNTSTYQPQKYSNSATEAKRRLNDMQKAAEKGLNPVPADNNEAFEGHSNPLSSKGN